MCGISGFFGGKNDSELRKMTECLKSRGPDSNGYYSSEKCSLGVRRLAIVDTDSGQQPISNEESTIWSVFNGEIYNFKELKSNLKSKGHEFSTNCDSEVIVHLYEENDESFVEELNGMFSIALWDEKSEKLLIYRDRIGIKPLFYAEYEDKFYFGSEIKSILKSGIKKEPDLEGLSYFWHLRYIPSPLTGFKHIKQVNPGEFVRIESGEITKRSFWSLESNDSEKKENIDYSERLRSLLEDSVEKRMMSDDDVGAFLSGGVDSSSVVALMDEISEDAVKTYSVVFDASEHDEREYSRLISEEFNTDHTEIEIDNKSHSAVEEILKQFSNPTADTAVIPTYLMSKAASNDVKVVNTGTGSDELFAGYKRYIRAIERYKICNIPSDRLKQFSKNLSNLLPNNSKTKNYLEYFGNSQSHEQIYHYQISEPEIPFKDSSNLLEDISEEFNKENDYISKMLRFDQLYRLPGMLLNKIDICGMSNSLEARVPFLDHNIIEFSRNIPAKEKIEGKNEKRILKNAVEDVLPEKTLKRDPKGLSVPIEKWIRDEESSISSRFKRENFENIDFLDTDEIMEKYSDLMEGNDTCKMYLWKALVLQIWHEEYIQKD